MSTTPPHTIVDGFATARGVETDHDWALEALTFMTLLDVAQPAVDDILSQALDLVRSSGEGPEELFGPARDHVTEQLARRREEGQVLAPPDPDSSWRDVPVLASIVACAISLLLVILLAVRGEWVVDHTPGMLALAPVSALTVLGALTVYENVLMRGRFALAVLAGGIVGAVGVALLTTAFVLGNDHPLWTGNLLVLLALAVGYGMLAAVLERILPTGGRGPGRGLDDEGWAQRLSGMLRLRADMPERRVQQIVAEAREHAAESGSTLVEEFGRPEDYAARWAPDQVTKARRKFWLVAALLLPLGLVVAFGDGLSWWGVLILVLVSWQLVEAWRGLRRAGQGVAPGTRPSRGGMP